jgi:hypothetical protein
MSGYVLGSCAEGSGKDFVFVYANIAQFAGNAIMDHPQQASQSPESGTPPEQIEENSSGMPWWRSWKVMVPLWLLICVLVWLGFHYKVDRGVIAGSVIVIGLISNAFAWLLGIIAFVPLVGPLIVKVLSIGFVWLINAVGYLVSFIAIRRGYSKDVLTYRGLTIAVIIGIVIGYVMGKLI